MAPRKWTREVVIERIQSHHQQGMPLGKIRCYDSRLCMVSISLFGSWRAALEAAGFQSVQQKWSRERILKELKEEHSKSLSNNGCHQRRDLRFARAILRHFGSRHAALIAAGITPKRRPRVRRSWTPAEVIAAIVAHHEQGLPLVNVKKCDVTLVNAARKTFGGWHKAKVAAGLACNNPQMPTRDEIICNLQSRHQRGESLFGLSQSEAIFYRSILSRFGGLNNALTAAGIPTQLPQRWNKRSVIEAIRFRHMKGSDLSTAWKDDKQLFNAASNHFGGWKSAVKAAGVRVKKHEKWTKERVLEALRRTYHGQSFNEVDLSLVGAANRCFGGFYIAVEAAGLDLPRRKWSRQRIIRLIQEYYVQGHRLGTSGFGEKLFAANAKRYFGSWREAVAAAGLESRMPPPLTKRTWSEEGVLEAIRSFFESGGKASKAREDWGMYSFAKKHFGSWRAAVLAAGCKAAQRSWTRDIVIHEIQERHRRNQPLTCVVNKEDSPLAGAALSYFGSWRAALLAAGIRQRKVPRLKSTVRRSQRATKLEMSKQIIDSTERQYDQK